MIVHKCFFRHLTLLNVRREQSTYMRTSVSFDAFFYTKNVYMYFFRPFFTF